MVCPVALCGKTDARTRSLGNEGRDNKVGSKKKRPNIDLLHSFRLIIWRNCGNMPQERDPFPFPRYENDFTLTERKEIQVSFFIYLKVAQFRFTYGRFWELVFFICIYVFLTFYSQLTCSETVIWQANPSRTKWWTVEETP